MPLWLGSYICLYLSIYLSIFLCLVVGFRPRFHGYHLAPSEGSCLKRQTTYQALTGSTSGTCEARGGRIASQMAKFLIFVCASLHVVRLSSYTCANRRTDEQELEEGRDAWSIFIWQRQHKKAVIRGILWVPLYVKQVT